MKDDVVVLFIILNLDKNTLTLHYRSKKDYKGFMYRRRYKKDSQWRIKIKEVSRNSPDFKMWRKVVNHNRSQNHRASYRLEVRQNGHTIVNTSFHTLKEVQDLLGVSKPTIRKYYSQGILVRDDLIYYFKKEDIYYE